MVEVSDSTITASNTSDRTTFNPFTPSLVIYYFLELSLVKYYDICAPARSNRRIKWIFQDFTSGCVRVINYKLIIYLDYYITKEILSYYRLFQDYARFTEQDCLRAHQYKSSCKLNLQI